MKVKVYEYHHKLAYNEGEEQTLITLFRNYFKGLTYSKRRTTANWKGVRNLLGLNEEDSKHLCYMLGIDAMSTKEW